MVKEHRIEPAVNTAEDARFKELLQGSNCYLEYGCGGSTVYACNNAKVKTVISVEIDKTWADKVRGSLGNTDSSVYIEYCNLGEVGEYGKPKTLDNIQEYWKYMVTPWEIARQNHLVPDVVLIDGRFRVASFLYSLVSARVGTSIFFDDYFDRPYYFIVEEFCQLTERHGRMALFTVSHNYALTDLIARIAQYSVVPD